MKKILIYIITSSLFITNLIGQNNISYKISFETKIEKPIKETKKKESKNLNKQEKDAIKYTDAIYERLYSMTAYSELIITNNESFYKTKKMLESDQTMITSRNTFNAFISHNGLYYYNKETNLEIIEKNAFGEDFLITNTRDSINWTITKEKKIIAGFACYKATADVKVKSAIRKGATKSVAVWFTPTIPINFGPIDYSGLPGLILEVKVMNNLGNIITTATKIELEEENIEIKKPNKGKIVTQEEFDEIGRKIYKNKFNTN